MPSRPAVTTVLGRPPAIAATGVLTLLVVVWAAAVPRPERMIPSLRPGLEVKEQAPAEFFDTFEPDVLIERDPTPGAQTSDVVAAVFGWATIGLLALGAFVALWVIGRAVLAAVSDRRRPPPSDPSRLDLDALAVAVAMDAGARRDALSGGTPAEGVVAAWTHLEATLHEAGVPLRASRTSTEVTVDVLRRFTVDPETLATLADLYREARWSRHALTENDRMRAAEAYRTLEAALRQAIPQAGGRGRG